MNSKTLTKVILVLIVIAIGFYLIKRAMTPKKIQKRSCISWDRGLWRFN